MTKQAIVTLEHLRFVLDYDPDTGEFSWMDSRPRSPGCLNAAGYWVIGIGERGYYAHRLAWFYVYGEWPKRHLDHINRNKKDNRIVNLREATPSQNQTNTVARGASGLKGAYWHEKRKKWYSKIGFSGKLYHLGYYSSKEEAHQAWATAAVKQHGPYVRLA